MVVIATINNDPQNQDDRGSPWLVVERSQTPIDI